MLDQPLSKIKPRQMRTAEEWQLVFKQWQRSGLSKSAYCKLEHITLSCFDRWHKRLVVSANPNDLSQSNKSLGDAFVSQFIPVGIGGVKHADDRDLKLDITLASGHRICVERASWGSVIDFLTSAIKC